MEKSKEDFLNPKNINMCLDWVVERHRIHKRKDIEKLSPPWSVHEGFDQHYCNVKRRQDRESRNLINGVCHNDKLTLKDKMINCIIFRCINRYDTFKLLGLPRKLDQGKYTFDELETISEKVKKFEEDNPKTPIFTNAYMISGNIRGLDLKIKATDELSDEEKERYFALHSAVRQLYLFNIYFDKLDEFLQYDNAKDLFAFFKKAKMIGFSTFLGYQIFLDWTYCPEYTVSDNVAVLSGPGCDYGLQCLYGYNNLTMGEFKKHVRANGQTPESLLCILRDNTKRFFENYRDFDGNKVDLDELFDDLPQEEHTLKLNDWENIMCEFSKYFRHFHGGRKIKRHYDFSKYNTLGKW